MAQLTIRGVDDNLQQLLRREAARRSQSINRYVLSLLRQATGMSNAAQAEPQEEFHDLDHLAGTWTEQESTEFEAQLAAQRGIDDDLWR